MRSDVLGHSTQLKLKKHDDSHKFTHFNHHLFESSVETKESLLCSTHSENKPTNVENYTIALGCSGRCRSRHTSHQSLQDYKEAEESVQSPVILKSPVVTRRLPKFESITKSEDQQHDDFPVSIRYQEDNPITEDDQSVDEILQNSLVELTEILRTLETNDPFKAMRIPLHVIPMQSQETLLVFQSLLKMLSNTKESHSSTPWQQYLRESISNQQCSEVDFCREFHQNFKCDKEDHLETIILDNKGLFDRLNLLMIPNTVNVLSLRRCKLKSISAWADLKNKSLKNLFVNGNKHLELNLDGLKGALNHLPLEYLTVSRFQISAYFGMQSVSPTDPAFCRVQEWMKVSTLVYLRVLGGWCGKHRNDILFCRDGTYTNHFQHQVDRK